MRNNTKKTSKLQSVNVVYDFTCPHEGCTLRKSNYIGMTTTSLSRRLTMHLQAGSIKEHMTQQHNISLDRKQVEDNTVIIRSCNDVTRLHILEALYIRERCPSINNQTTGQERVLSLFNQPRSATNSNNYPNPIHGHRAGVPPSLNELPQPATPLPDMPPSPPPPPYNLRSRLGQSHHVVHRGNI